MLAQTPGSFLQGTLFLQAECDTVALHAAAFQNAEHHFMNKLVERARKIAGKTDAELMELGLNRLCEFHESHDRLPSPLRFTTKISTKP